VKRKEHPAKKFTMLRGGKVVADLSEKFLSQKGEPRLRICYESFFGGKRGGGEVKKN